MLKRIYFEIKNYGINSSFRALYFILSSKVNKNKLFVTQVHGKPFHTKANSLKLGIDGLIYSRKNKFEFELKSYFCCEEGKAFWDIGSNYGYWSSYVLEKYQNLKIPPMIYAVEPYEPNFSIFEKNLKGYLTNGKIKLFKFALGSYSHENYINMTNSDPGSTFVTSVINKNSSKIKIESLDNLYNSCDLKPIGLIKIDVEGYEFEVLKGSLNVLRKYKPVIICELIRRYLVRAASSPEDVENFMNNEGYSIKLILPDGKLHYKNGYIYDGNYLCKPFEK